MAYNKLKIMSKLANYLIYVRQNYKNQSWECKEQFIFSHKANVPISTKFNISNKNSNKRRTDGEIF